MCSLYAAGASIRWAKNLLREKPIGEYADQAPAGSNGLIYPPFMFGSTVPVKNNNARAVFFGQKPEHSLPHFAQAVVEMLLLTVRMRFVL